MGKKIIILGGRKSGKSLLAEELIQKLSRDGAIYIATSRIEDEEMEERINEHRKRRNPNYWLTYEEDLDLIYALEKAQRRKLPVMIECLSLWVSNLAYENRDIEFELNRLEKFLANFELDIIFVSLEVGLGIVPMDKIARKYCDNLGKVNQHISKICDEAYLVVAGNPLKLK